MFNFHSKLVENKGIYISVMNRKLITVALLEETRTTLWSFESLIYETKYVDY